MSEPDISLDEIGGMSFVSDRPDSGFDQMLNLFGIGLFTLLLFLGLAQVANRFIVAPLVGVSVTWTGEAARFVLIYMTLIGSVIASRDRDHIKIEFLIDRLSESKQPLARGIIHLVSIVFLVVAAWGGYLATQSVIGVPPGAVPLITLEYVYAIIPLGLSAMALYELQASIELFTQYARERGATDE